MHLILFGDLMKYFGNLIINIDILRISQMTAAVIITGSILGVIGIGFSIWSIINTRKRYYEEYMRRKRRADD